VSGLHSRNKGRRGETEACHLLAERGWEIVELGPGRLSEDVLATDSAGRRFSVEVKNHRVWRLCAWRTQAKAQAKARGCRWLLLCRVPNMPGTFYVEGSCTVPTVWRGNVARRGTIVP